VSRVRMPSECTNCSKREESDPLLKRLWFVVVPKTLLFVPQHSHVQVLRFACQESVFLVLSPPKETVCYKQGMRNQKGSFESRRGLLSQQDS